MSRLRRLRLRPLFPEKWSLVPAGEYTIGTLDKDPQDPKQITNAYPSIR